MDFISTEWMTLIISAIPILEQRQYPYGIIQGIGFWEVYILTLIGRFFHVRLFYLLISPLKY